MVPQDPQSQDSRTAKCRHSLRGPFLCFCSRLRCHIIPPPATFHQPGERTEGTGTMETPTKGSDVMKTVFSQREGALFLGLIVCRGSRREFQFLDFTRRHLGMSITVPLSSGPAWIELHKRTQPVSASPAEALLSLALTLLLHITSATQPNLHRLATSKRNVVELQ